MNIQAACADDIIKRLNLQPHPEEGGYFAETYRSADVFSNAALPNRYSSERCAATAIYYLLTPLTISALHRLQSDEIFHFYAGSPVRMLQLYPDGSGQEIIIGADILAGQLPQVIVPRGVWQGAHMISDSAFALLGCTVAPGFEFVDYEHGEREKLTRQFPKFAEAIERLTVS